MMIGEPCALSVCDVGAPAEQLQTCDVLCVGRYALFFSDGALGMSSVCPFVELSASRGQTARGDPLRNRTKRLVNQRAAAVREQRRNRAKKRKKLTGMTEEDCGSCSGVTIDDDKRFISVEHYMYYMKAMLGNDVAAMLRLLSADSVDEVRSVGERVVCSDAVWGDVRCNTAYTACRMKVEQHRELRAVLLSERLSGKRLVYCVSSDDVDDESDAGWGISVSRDALLCARSAESDDDEEDDAMWAEAVSRMVEELLSSEGGGQGGGKNNCLGRILERVREEAEARQRANPFF